MHYEYEPEGVCAMQIEFDIGSAGTVSSISFFGGCDGNLKAIAKLLDGESADKIYALLSGNTCGRKQTSCADQLASAVMKAKIECCS